ncbi:helix-turn-helix domain-containing protein [Psychromonas sp. GE-S-Ul-11]|uniref:helix-turn-helix domain-containing protein n=1 Tax=Psychromonas sp. GE-S-Ul-11 TaxID=3241170 RepID=UPI00390C6ACE
MSDLINETVAIQLKKIRTEKGWSLDTASQYCGVSKAMLGQIERGESSPTIAKLWKIATGFNLPLSAFLGAKNEETFQADDLSKNKKISINTVFEFDKKTGIEMFELCFSIGHEQLSEAHQTGVIEHIVVKSGEMEYFSGSQWHRLATGESAKFNADQAHGYRNVGNGVLRFFNIIHYP